MVKFSPKDPSETVPLDFDFDPYRLGADEISGSPTISVTVYTGVDADPSDLLSGAAAVIGDKVRQNVRNGTADVEYLVKATITTVAGYTYTIGRVLPVKVAGTY